MTVSVCVSCCCPASLCTFKSSGWGGGGGDRKTERGGGRWDLLGSLSFLLREQLRFPAGDGWPGLRGGMLRPLAPSHSLCGDRCSCRGPVPLHHPSTTPASSPASSHQVSDPCSPVGALGWQGGASSFGNLPEMGRILRNGGWSPTAAPQPEFSLQPQFGKKQQPFVVCMCGVGAIVKHSMDAQVGSRRM